MICHNRKHVQRIGTVLSQFRVIDHAVCILQKELVLAMELVFCDTERGSQINGILLHLASRVLVGDIRFSARYGNIIFCLLPFLIQICIFHMTII